MKIMESLKTIQNSLIYENGNNNIYYTSFKYQITENLNTKKSPKNNQKNKSSQYLHKLISQESNMVIKKNLIMLREYLLSH